MTKIQFELDGQQVEAINGETIWQVAKRQGREIPHLCYSPEPDYRPDGNCRACMVEVEGERVLADSCIQCGLCVRACREVQVNDVIGMAYRSHESKIVFDFDDPMGESTCVACGECVQACPTGALMPSVMLDENQTRVTYPDKKVDSLCPFCGVGCQVTYQVKDEKVIYAEGRDGPANHNRLCVKGRFGFDY